MNDKSKILKAYQNYKDNYFDANDAVKFASKYMKDQKYQKAIYNAQEQIYTYGANDKSGDIWYLLNDIDNFVKSIKND